MKGLFLFLINFYKRVVSPMLPPSCRFYPSCSDYAYEAVETHGALKGMYLAARRVMRCHPYNPGGYDPVPGRIKGKEDPKRTDIIFGAGINSLRSDRMPSQK